MSRYRNIDEHHRALTNARTLTSIVERVERCQTLPSAHERYRTLSSVPDVIER